MHEHLFPLPALVSTRLSHSAHFKRVSSGVSLLGCVPRSVTESTAWTMRLSSVQEHGSGRRTLSAALQDFAMKAASGSTVTARRSSTSAPASARRSHDQMMHFFTTAQMHDGNNGVAQPVALFALQLLAERPD